jgi:hypothetical protein
VRGLKNVRDFEEMAGKSEDCKQQDEAHECNVIRTTRWLYANIFRTEDMGGVCCERRSPSGPADAGRFGELITDFNGGCAAKNHRSPPDRARSPPSNHAQG